MMFFSKEDQYQLEKKITKWIIKRRYHVLLLCLILLVSISLPSLPYINLYVNKDFSIFFISASFIIIFSINYKYIFLLMVLLLILSLFFILLGEPESAEIVGNYIYGFLFIGIIRYAFNVGRET